MKYTLDGQLLTNYARVLVHYGLNGGKGINAGETVFLLGNECAKPLFMEVYKEIVAAGGNVILQYLPDEFDRFLVNAEMAKNGTDAQLDYAPFVYQAGLVSSMDHQIAILAMPKRRALEGVPAANITKMMTAYSTFIKMRGKKEQDGKLSWTMCLYGTEAAAEEAGMTEEEYWEEIINACYLRDEDPVATWKKLQQETETVRAKLDALKIETLHVEGPDVDLHLKIGSDRKWLGGTGRNIPSYEIFTSPDWRGTNGWIRFSMPLYYAGKRISGIQLRFEYGIITKATAAKNEDALLSLIAVEDANKLGEFSLTDKRHSRISKFMATTLYDENTGGSEGNTHVAVGRCFPETYIGEEDLNPDQMHTEHGFNKCTQVHVDMISTTKRKVTARLHDGSEVVIYENGQFTLD